MAKLRKVRELYRARVRFTRDGRKGEASINLNTYDYKVALVRLNEVELQEKKVKAGYDIEWSWKTGKKSQIKIYRLREVADLWLKLRKDSIDIRDSHYKRNIISMNRFVEVFKDDYRVADINDEDIEKFKTYYSKRHSLTGIYINLRAIKTFLKWCLNKGYIDKLPLIKIKKVKQDPRYIREEWFDRIMRLDIDEHWKKAFQLYATTGARKMEVFDGYLDGDLLIVPPEKSKTNTKRVIKLNPYQKSIVKEMQSRLKKHIENGYKSSNYCNRYNKIFVQCLKKIGVYRKGYSLHSLRHTFAIVTYLKTKDIYKVMQLMGHSSVTTTEVYSKMDQHEILYHFKSLRGKWEHNSGNNGQEIKVITFEKPLQLQRTSNP